MKDAVDIIFKPTPSIERLYLELTNRVKIHAEL